MMGRISQDQGQLFYSFNLEEVVPDDHLVRAIARILDLSFLVAASASARFDRIRYPVPPASRITGERHAPVTARLQPARRQLGVLSRFDQSRSHLRAAHRAGEGYRAHLAHFLWHGTAYQRFAVRNYGNRATDLQLSILFENDFADLFEVRGSHRDRRGSEALRG